MKSEQLIRRVSEIQRLVDQLSLPIGIVLPLEKQIMILKKEITQFVSEKGGQ